MGSRTKTRYIYILYQNAKHIFGAYPKIISVYIYNNIVENSCYNVWTPRPTKIDLQHMED